MGYIPQCWYWNVSPYASLGGRCVTWNVSGECSKYEYADGSSLKSDHNGRFEDCAAFSKQIRANLKIVKTCQGNAVANGCIGSYEGNDSLKKIADPNLTEYDLTKATSGCGGWRKNYITKTSYAFILDNGSSILAYGSSFNPHIFAFDVNGKKGPNKWGYDLFGIQTIGNITGGTRLYSTGCMPIETKGIGTTTMINNIYK